MSAFAGPCLAILRGSPPVGRSFSPGQRGAIKVLSRDPRIRCGLALLCGLVALFGGLVALFGSLIALVAGLVALLAGLVALLAGLIALLG